MHFCLCFMLIFLLFLVFNLMRSKKLFDIVIAALYICLCLKPLCRSGPRSRAGRGGCPPWPRPPPRPSRGGSSPPRCWRPPPPAPRQTRCSAAQSRHHTQTHTLIRYQMQYLLPTFMGVLGWPSTMPWPQLNCGSTARQCYHQCRKSIHRFHNRFSQSRRRPLLGPSP